MSVTISSVYLAGEGTEFDFDQYVTGHLALVRQRWEAAGLTGVEAYRGLADATGGAPRIQAMALLHFRSAEAMQAAMTGEHIAEIAADVANFTNVQPILQVNVAL